jgi:type IV pilus assembly protein PilE
MVPARVHKKAGRQAICGFTLIELMITVIVIGVLAAVAYPSFLSQIRASRRAEAVSTLSQIQQAQERWRANCPCYAGSLTAAPHATNPGGCPTTDCAATNGLGLSFTNPRYSFSMPTAPASSAPNTYALSASAVGGQGQDRAGSVSCGTLTVTVTNGVPANGPAACFRQ